MDLKRQFEQDDECDVDENILVSSQPSKRSREDNSQQLHTNTCVIGNWSMVGIPSDMMFKSIEDLTKKIVREELERWLAPIPRSITNESGACEGNRKLYKLVFENELPDTVYIASEIKAKDDDEERPVVIALKDIRSDSIVTCGPLSSLRVEICVLKTDDERILGSESWTTKRFKTNIIRRMDSDKAKLLKGNVVIQLNNGVACINQVMFTGSSSRTRSRLFRLGAFVQSTSRQADEVKEAISNLFMVKHARNQKSRRPLQNDPIWRLKNISKDGKIHEWLRDKLKINTVKDLLHVHETDPSSLQKKYGTKLKETIKHAKSCIEGVASSSHGQNTVGAMTGQCSAPLLHHLPITAHQDQVQTGQHFSQPSTSTSRIGEAFAASININDQFGSSLDQFFQENDYSSLLAPHDLTENNFSYIPFAN